MDFIIYMLALATITAMYFIQMRTLMRRHRNEIKNLTMQKAWDLDITNTLLASFEKRLQKTKSNYDLRWSSVVDKKLDKLGSTASTNDFILERHAEVLDDNEKRLKELEKSMGELFSSADWAGRDKNFTAKLAEKMTDMVEEHKSTTSGNINAILDHLDIAVVNRDGMYYVRKKRKDGYFRKSKDKETTKES